ncbi:MAG TPA: alpha/beta hydrolase [Novosphingobium sp.]|nr:alpha/beta hydrolase [Novosphingobium sp.]
MGTPDPAAMMAAVEQRRSELLARCPLAPPSLTSEEAAAVPINIIELGTSGPSVLIVHGGLQGGLGGAPATFDKQKVLADHGWRLRFVERPGFGQSASRGVDDMEADAEWIADMLGNGSHLVGHSWGGAAALLAAARRPEAVRSLTLIEPALFPIVMTDPVLRSDPEMQLVGGRLAQLMLQSRTPAEYALGFARTVLGSPDDDGTKALVAKLAGDESTAASMGCALLHSRMASPATMRAAAHTVAERSIPVLVVSGGWSPFFDRIGEVVASFTGGRFEVVPASNHMVQYTSADTFNPLLRSFLQAADEWGSNS